MGKRKTFRRKKLHSITRIDYYTGVELPFTRKVYKKNTLLYLPNLSSKPTYILRDVDPKTGKDIPNGQKKYVKGFLGLLHKKSVPNDKWYTKKLIFKSSTNGSGKMRQGIFENYLSPNNNTYIKYLADSKSFSTPFEDINKPRLECNYVTGIPKNIPKVLLEEASVASS